PAFFQLVHHPIIASANLANMLVSGGQNNLKASQARLSANQAADDVQTYFEEDWTIENQYHTMLDGKWDHAPPVARISAKKQALGGVMRISPENTLGAWPGDMPNQCTQGYNCPYPTVTLDNFDTFGNRYVD
ncbi:hypothetical protein H0H93_016434, partial [Arthromyces matolae]